MSLKPKKKYTNVICDVCDLAWDDHVAGVDGKVEATECIRLLKAAAKPAFPGYPFVSGGYYCTCGIWVFPGSAHSCAPYPVTYPYPTVTYTTSTSAINGNLSVVRDDEDPPDMGVPAAIR